MADPVKFDFINLPKDFSWFCEPANWRLESNSLRIETDADTDYWSKTHYGFVRHNGHFFHTSRSGSFLMCCHLRFQPKHQYDQAGLMIRFSPDCWLKTSIEYELDDPARLGVVVTNNGYSDWSTQDVDPRIRDIWLRIKRDDGCFLVESSRDNRKWDQLRLAYLADDHGQAVECGLYACSPEKNRHKLGGEYVAVFDHFHLESI